MTDTLQWAVPGERFEDGSELSDWALLEESGVWHWQYDTHELTFAIYRYDGQFWKLYRARTVPPGGQAYTYHFGGQACRMAQVEYAAKARSPHSARLMQAGDREWVRTYEVDQSIHTVIQAGQTSAKYGAPFGPKRAAA